MSSVPRSFVCRCGTHRTLVCGSAALALAIAASAMRAQDVRAQDVRAEDEDELTPPRVLSGEDPWVPESHAALLPGPPVVVVHVTVEPDGTISEAHLESAGDPVLDAIALEEIRHWRFAPALRGETPIRSRARVEMRFRVPEAPDAEPDAHEGHAHGESGEDVTEEPEPDPEPAREDREPEPEATAPEPPEFQAEAEVDPLRESRAPRAASDYQIDRRILEAAPRRDAADLLSSAPGVFVARPEGDAIAQQVFLRGFDAEHGQDLEMTLGGGVMPINLPSHIHGQGYADLGFLIPEVVRGLRVTEGVYDPRQGDFATAGTIDFDLGVERRGVQLRTSYGSFDTFRGLILWAPEGEAEETFGAATFRQTNGFGRNRAGLSGGTLVQWAFGSGELRGRVHGAVWAARSSIAGFLRRDDIDAGRVGFLDVYDDPSALAQSALSAHAHLGGVLEVRGRDGSFGEMSLFVRWAHFRLAANYTGYLERSQVNASWVGRGDLIEQRNETAGLGLRGRYRTPRITLFEWLTGFVEVGVQSRFDAIGQAQSLLAMPQNEIWDRRADADVRALDAGAYVDLDWWITSYVRVRGGLRADALFFDVDDRLANFIPDERPDTYIVGYRRSALGFAVGPRASVEVMPIQELTLSLAYGEGYRSPQARQLQDGESAPFARVRSGDLGARLTLGPELTVAASGYVTAVSDDTAFDPGEGRLEPIGPSTRIGAALRLETQPVSFLTAAISTTFVHATLDAPPRPSIDNPVPEYRPGEALPFVPPWVVRADLSAGDRIFDLADQPFIVRAGVGFSFLSPRPLPYGLFAEPVALLDASVSARWSALDLSIEVFNLADQRYAAVEYSYSSYWDRGAVPSRIPARHISAGAPITVMASLGVTL